MRLDKHLRIAVAGLVVLAAAGPLPGVAGDKEPQADPDLFTHSIDIGRMGVMLDQGREGLGLSLNARKGQRDSVDIPLTVAQLYAQLALTILDYNQLLTEACLHGEVTGSLCAAYFWPSWLDVPVAGAKLSKRDGQKLPERISEVQAKVGALSGELCAKGTSLTGDEFFCAIE